MTTKKSTLTILITSIMLLSISCTNNDNQKPESNAGQEGESSVITQEDQAKGTPQEVLTRFKEGNERFVNNNLTHRNFVEQAKKTSGGQFPEAVVLSCIDSRVPVEHLFDKGVGDIFVGRIAGNFANEDMIGSLEYSTEVAGSKLVVIMGHKSCGAVKAAIDGVELGNITAMLEHIKPAVEMTDDFEGEQSTDNEAYVTEVVKNNVRHTIEEIRRNSPIIRQLEQNGDVLIAGAFYDIETGKVVFLN